MSEKLDKLRAAVKTFVAANPVTTAAVISFIVAFALGAWVF